VSRGKRVPAPENTLRIALSLARAGWPVFPVSIYRDDSGKRHKVPAVPRGTSWVDWATTNPEKIADAWQNEHRESWVGVHVGAADLLVLDVDREPDDGKAFLKAAGLKPPPTFRYKTLGGGTHHLYRAPRDVEVTNAQGLMYQGERVKGVDVRGGRGLFVYYGPELAGVPELAPAPDWAIVEATKRAADLAPTGDAATFRARLVDGEPSKALRKLARRTDFPAGAAHAPMLEVVTALVGAGVKGEPGVGALLDETRERYVGDHPDRGRDWDNAVAGSVKRLGMPPVTLPVPKAERKVIAERNTPEAVEEAKRSRKALLVVDRIERGEGQLTDAALSEAIADELEGAWAYVKGAGLLRYDGRVWSPAEDAALVEVVRRRLRVLRAEETKAAILAGNRRHEEEARQLEGRGRIVAIAKLIEGILGERTPSALDAHHDLLNTPNGVVDLRTGELGPHDWRLMFTRITKAEYHPDADRTMWNRALEALPNEKVRAWLQLRFGQALTGHTPDDARMLILEGSGENAKSTVFDGIRAATGDRMEGGYSVTVSKRLLMANPGDHPTELTELMGARIAFAEELPDGRNLDVSRLKDVVGTTTITARRMHRDSMTWAATHAIFVNTNYRLAVNETDHGTWRRLALVLFPFRYVKPGDPLVGARDRRADLRVKPYFEKTADPGVLAWLVEGARRWYEAGMMMPPMPKRVVRDTEDWREDADPVLGYVRDRLVVEPGHAIAAVDLAHDFNAYLEARSHKPWSESTIAARFRDHVSLPNVEKRQVRFGKSLTPSRPASMLVLSKPLPPATKAWVGVRFASEADRVPSEAERDAAELADLERRASA
jgi:putative DNA primase/helicase